MASPEALRGKLQKDIDLKSSAADYYKLWRKESHKIPTASSKNIQAVALHEGDWHTNGAIKRWNYTLDGKSAVFKEKMEFDDANMTVTIHGMEGDVFDEYKVYRGTCKVVPKNKGSVAKLGVEYERVNEDAPIPNKYMDFFVSVSQDIDAHAYTAST
ncbi:MLP-like protein 328 [Punica granatum]|uniref:Bet v I/Major latex protein domain-containing protein n=2 Tax=Punica granatum TaxID=22663 RepID=A0A218WCT8_PUNGR|nr:MLP-like protein 328 [Punica granatum]OWM70343.1 hypothetical protein CDL15_Pgr004480 [Punica granatum]PKI61384.1 hypothetical protein CRG98_018232 [Punica granatum]